MCSTDQLKERIEFNKEGINKLDTKVDKILETVKNIEITITGKVEKYDDRYVLRRDFKIVSAVVGTAISILAFFGFSK